MQVPSRQLLEAHHVFVDKDGPFQKRARLLQALWREKQGLPLGERSAGKPLGSRLPLEFAEATGRNLMTEAARGAARREIDAAHPLRGSGKKSSGQKIEKDRLWANLLSSQPLAFSLLADFERDLGGATRVLRRLWPSRIGSVTSIRFEYSPGRSDPRFTADKTAFDIYVEQTTPSGGRGFVGIEVKYSENLLDQPAPHRTRYDELTAAMACFSPERLAELRQRPIEQICRDHMLMGSMLLDLPSRWDDGFYVFLHPKDNEPCIAAIEKIPPLPDRSDPLRARYSRGRGRGHPERDECSLGGGAPGPLSRVGKGRCAHRGIPLKPTER